MVNHTPRSGLLKRSLTPFSDATGRVNTQMSEIAKPIKAVGAEINTFSEKALDQQDTARRVNGELNKVCV